MNRDFYILREHENMQTISDALNSSGYEFKITVLNQNVTESNNYVSRQLGLPIASKIFYLCRLFSVNDVPRCLESIYADLSYVREMATVNLSTASLNEMLQGEKGIGRLIAREEILIVEATGKERELLQLDEADNEIMMIKGTVIKENDRPLAYYELLCDSEFVRYRGVSVYE